MVKQRGTDSFFTIDTIGNALFERMKAGNSWKTNTPIELRSQLRYLHILHVNVDGASQMGEMIVNEKIANKVLKIFKSLYDARYPIERMLLVDEYHADDETAMRANNTSCFNFRFKSNSTTDISNHGYGLAIDINP